MTAWYGLPANEKNRAGHPSSINRRIDTLPISYMGGFTGSLIKTERRSDLFSKTLQPSVASPASCSWMKRAASALESAGEKR